MEDTTAARLLERIRNEKKAGSESTIGSTLIPDLSVPKPRNVALVQAVKSRANARMQEGSINDVLKALLFAGGAGAALRGFTGMQRMFSEDAKPVSSRTVDMPVVYPADKEEKQADNSKATAPYGLDYFIPGMVLGAPLAAYAGWKGVDAIMDSQRRKKTEADKEEAQNEYQDALLGSYKLSSDGRATEAELDSIFDQHFDGQTKEAGWFSDLTDKYAPNLPGAAKGLALTYAIPATVGGYAMVDSVMKKHSKRRLLQKAMQERARRQARQQPAELYAIPVPREEEKSEVEG